MRGCCVRRRKIIKMNSPSYKTTILRSAYGRHAVARRARGYSMGVVQDGWLVFYDALNRPPRDELIGKLCVAKLKDGRIILRFVHEGKVEAK
jgi:hypothetical protein